MKSRFLPLLTIAALAFASPVLAEKRSQHADQRPSAQQCPPGLAKKDNRCQPPRKNGQKTAPGQHKQPPKQGQMQPPRPGDKQRPPQGKMPPPPGQHAGQPPKHDPRADRKLPPKPAQHARDTQRNGKRYAVGDRIRGGAQALPEKDSQRLTPGTRLWRVDNTIYQVNPKTGEVLKIMGR